MDAFLIGMLLAVSVIMLFTGLNHRGGIFEFPFLAGATFLGFVVPSLPGLMHDRFLPPGAFTMTVSFTIGCAAMCLIGWRAATRPVAWMQRVNLDEDRMVWVAAAFSAFGAFFFYKLSLLPDYMKYESMPTGLPTVYYFFGQAVVYGFGLASLCCARRLSTLAVLVFLFDLSLLGSRVLVGGKREDSARIVLTVLLALWFRRNYAFPRIPALVGIMVASLSIANVGAYRGLVQEDNHKAPTWSQVSNIHIIDNFEKLVANGGEEMRNAMLLISNSDNDQDFDFGIFHWDILVWDFVPAQLLGSDFKQSLIFPLHEDMNYQPAVGSTETGMTDAFRSFWYFGVLKFFLIAYLMARIYRTALAGNALAQFVYILSVAPSMLTITHHTQWIFSAWVHMLLLLGPALLFARRRQPSRAMSERREPVFVRERLAPRNLS